MALVFIYVGSLEITAIVGALKAVSKMVLYHLPASGKTTLADRVHDILSAKGLRVERLYGVIVVASFISPYRESREFVRSLCRRYIEVYVSMSPEECARGDTREMYRRARAGEIQNFTGVSDPYEEPENAEIVVDNEYQGVDESVAFIMKAPRKRL